MNLPKILDNAIFIADAHYPHHGDEFYQLLVDIDSGVLKPSQIFLMGDIFDLLFGYNEYIKSFSLKAIELLNKISLKIPIIYIEGNHDFSLETIFKDISIYPQSQQPLYFDLDGKVVALSHGDLFDTPLSYRIYSKILRNRYTLTILKVWQKSIIDYRMAKLAQKSICRKFIDFESKVDRILNSYRDVDLVVEGHFHQGVKIKNYISLPSLACQKQIATIENGNFVFVDL